MEPLTKNECEIMNLFWATGISLSKSDIVRLSTQRSWKEKSIHVLLNSLLAKGMIEVDGFASTRTNYGRTFRPCYTQEEYIASILQAGGYPVKVNASKLFSALHANGEIDESTISDLEVIIQEIKNQQRSE